MNRRWLYFLLLAGLMRPRLLFASAGTEAASFLDIPTGAQPAALASAYSAAAADAYAPVWNPAGLGFLDAPQFAGTHQAYLESVHYEFLGYVHPLGSQRKDEDDEAHSVQGLGLGVQYLGSGKLDGRDDSGQPTGSFTSAMAAYTLAYAHRLGDRWALGTGLKAITERISDASGTSGAADLGLLWKPAQTVSVGFVAANLGPDLKLEGSSPDPLPMAARLGTLWRARPDLDVCAETVYRRTKVLSGSIAAEYKYGDVLSVRGGYNTAHTETLGWGGGVTAGIGLFLFGQELAYAWTPYGSLGASHYLSILIRFTRAPRQDRKALKAAADNDPESMGNLDPTYKSLYEMLDADEMKALKKEPKKKGADEAP